MNPLPNILLILCHDLGQRLGCYGVPGLRAPALDALASEGALCEDSFATAPLCSPSRGSLMTGLYPHTHGLMGLVNRGWDMPDTHPTLAQLLQGNGYTARLFGGRCCSEVDSPHVAHKTLLFGFQHEKREPMRMGYQEHHHAEGPYTCDTVTDEFIAWLHARDRADPPFFACLGFFEVHRPFEHPRYTPDDPAAVAVPAYLPDEPEVRQELAAMHGMIFAVDAAMARLLDALDRAGQAENTLLIFSTDHGIAFPRAKSTLYDPGIATALILRWPAGFAGRRHTALISHIDLLPTILECVGLPAPHVQGRSFLALLRGEAYQPREAIFAEKNWHDHYDPIRAARTDRFKYIRNFADQDGSPPERRPRLVLPADLERSPTRRVLARLGDPHLAPRPAEELYDLTADPHELRDVATDPAYAAALADMRARLEDWMRETADPLLEGPIACPDPATQFAEITDADIGFSSQL